MNDFAITESDIYEKSLPNGSIYGKIGEQGIKRFVDTAKHICLNAESILDVGCGNGDWLYFICQRLSIKKHLGIDVSKSRINNANKFFPELNVKACSITELELLEKSFDVVTCLEVLEHVPDWIQLFNLLFRFASKQVLITVSYREKIKYTECIHCGKLTPMYGHLRSYSEESFPQVLGWSLSFAKIREKDPNINRLRRIYHFFRPHYPWLLVNYRRVC